MAQMQLKMTRYAGPVKERTLPAGYTFKLFDGSEREIDEWVRLCNFGLMENSTRDTFYETVGNFENVVATRDCFFVIDPEGTYIASSTAVANSAPTTPHTAPTMAAAITQRTKVRK